MTDEEVRKAIDALKKAWVPLKAVDDPKYLKIAHGFGVSPEELQAAILRFKGDKYRVYMREYMRRRRGSITRRVK
jgi:hypothetical protein